MSIQSNRGRLLMSLVMALVGGLSSLVFAQEIPTTLVPDEPIESTLSAENVADVYTFTTQSSATVTITATSQQIPLSLVMTDSDGVTIAEATSGGFGQTILDSVTIEQAGNYLVTVFAAATAPGPNGEYQIALTGLADDSADTATDPTPLPTIQASPEQPPAQRITSFNPPQDILIGNGIEVRLQWDAEVDLNLEVRDPYGNSLFFNNRETAIGGNLSFDANGLCEVISTDPVETATWGPNFLPTGSYEVLIYYREACGEATPQPVDFTLTTLVNGTELDPINATIPPVNNVDSVYLANFIINSDTSASINQGGYYPDSSLQQLPAPTSQVLANTQPINRDAPIEGVLVDGQDYLAYVFNAEANDVVTISMNATSGNLDTLLQLVGSNGNLLTVNDDSNNSTNSTISNYRIVQPGQYTIVATRYGKELGGTEGAFTLTLTGATETLPNEIINLGLPQGEIGVYLTWSTPADLQLLVRDPVGQAVYDDNTRVNSGGVLAAVGNRNCAQVEDGSPVSYIYWPSGFFRPGIYEVDVWYQNTCDSNLPTEFTLTLTIGGEVVAVERRIPSIGQRFVIRFELMSDGTVDVGQGGFNDEGISTLDINNEPTIPIQFNQPQNGSITLENNFDVYTFTGQTGQVVTVSMAATSQTLDTKLFLVDPNNVVIGFNDDIPAAELLGTDRSTDSVIRSLTLQQNGEYKIVATRYANQYGGTIGTYRLTLQPN